MFQKMDLCLYCFSVLTPTYLYDMVIDSWTRIRNFPVLLKLLGVCLLVAYLFFLEEGGAHFRLFLSNYYLQQLPFEADFIVSFIVWILLLVSAVLLIFSKLEPWALLASGSAVWYLKRFSVFAQCSWGTVLPAVLILLACSEWYRRYRRMEQGNCPNITVKAIEILISLIYFASVTQRLLDPSWLQGNITQLLLESRAFSRFTQIPWNQLSVFLKMGSYYVLLAEVLGVTLPFWKKRHKTLILILLPIHVILAIVSTEMVWQLFFLSLLFLVYQKEESNGPDKIGAKFWESLPSKFLVALLYVASLPYDASLSLIKKPVSIARGIISNTGLLPFTQFRLFHTRPVFATCFYIYGENHSGVQVLKSSELKKCLNGENYFFQDNLLHSTVRSFLDISSHSLNEAHLETNSFQEGITEVSRDISDRWGHAVCKSFSGSELQEAYVIVFNIFQDKSKYSVKSLPLSWYSCSKNQSMKFESVSREVQKLAHKDYLKLMHTLSEVSFKRN